MEGYKATIIDSSMELDAKTKIKLKDTGDCISLDEEVTSEVGLTIKPTGFVVLDIHNEKSDTKDYEKFVIITEDGKKYITGSNSFWSSFSDIYGELSEEGISDYEITIYKKESKNYKGKHFLTCSLA